MSDPLFAVLAAMIHFEPVAPEPDGDVAPVDDAASDRRLVDTGSVGAD